MSINSLIINTLSPVDVPVRFQELTKEDGSPDTYITFFFINENGMLFADDEEVQTAYFLQVDVFSRGNYTTLVEQVKSRLKEIGFVRTNAVDLYERDTKIYHKAMRFTFTSSLD